MDGVRAYWNFNQLVSRHGNSIPCPHWFTSAFPSDVTLDGELWLGQGTTFEDMNAVIKSNTSDWSGVRYYVFDIPSSAGPYEMRMKQMEAIKSVSPQIQIVQNKRCQGREHLFIYLDSIVAGKGEGIVLREPQSVYVVGPSSSLLKAKVL